MGTGSIILGAFAFICMIAGALLSLVPFLGTMLSFLAPVLALAGIILGGVALSRAKAGAGESEGLAVGGLVTSIIAFIPSVLVALTCGLCNVCATGMYLDPNFGTHDSGVHDGGHPLTNPSYPTPGIAPMPSPVPTPTTPVAPPPTLVFPPPTAASPSAAPPSAAPPSAAPLPPTPGAG